MPGEVRIGFVGCGAHAAMNLYPALQFAPIELVAVCDLDAERRERLRRRFGAEAAFDTVDALLEGPELDAIIVCGPPELHQEAAVKALDRGLHVLVEKPPAPDLAGALAIQEAARRNGRHCMVGFMKRFASRYQQAHEISRSRVFGRLTHLTVKYAHWNVPDLSWMLKYMSVHAFDLIRFFAGDLARITVEHLEIGGQHSYACTAVAKSGALVSLNTSSQEPRVKESVELVGEGELVLVRNVIELEYHRRVSPTRLFHSDLHDVQLLRPDFAIPNPDQNTLYLQGYAGELIEFANACLENRAPSVTIDDGVAAMRLVNLFASGKTGTFELEE
ncbi:MAG: hypothetical protein AMXMBFR82_09830 [Candidatus Hydrogenedentota bacterium]